MSSYHAIKGMIQYMTLSVETVDTHLPRRPVAVVRSRSLGLCLEVVYYYYRDSRIVSRGMQHGFQCKELGRLLVIGHHRQPLNSLWRCSFS